MADDAFLLRIKTKMFSLPKTKTANDEMKQNPTIFYKKIEAENVMYIVSKTWFELTTAGSHLV